MAEGLSRKLGTHPHPTEAGLYLRTGKTVSVWGYRFRGGKDENGDNVWESDKLGSFAELSVEQALDTYRAIRRKHAAKGTAQGMTVAEAFATWHRDSTKRGGQAKAGVTLAKYQIWFNSYIKPTADDWLMAEATTVQWMELLATCKVKSAHEARATFWMMHGIYAYFVDLDVLDRNPLAKQRLRDKFAGDDVRTVRVTRVETLDLPKFVDNVLSVRGKGSREIIMLLLMLGWRKTCVLRMKWAQIDFEYGIYFVQPGDPGWKGYFGPIALNTYALDYLKDWRRKYPVGDSVYVFGPAMRTATLPYRQDIRGAMLGASRGLERVIMAHDFRRTFITVADVITDGNLRLIGRIVGHAQKSIQGSSARQDGKQQLGSKVTGKYVVPEMRSEIATSQQIAHALMELAGIFPLSDEIEATFKRRGIDLKHLLLAEVEDDDDGT